MNNKIQEKEIDLTELFSKLMNRRKFIVKISLLGLLIGIVIAFSIPREYTTSIILAPESTDVSSTNMGALASLAGVNLGGSNSGDISTDVYPEIIKSTPFLLGLSKIHISNNNENVDLFNYIQNDQDKAWWTYIFAAPKFILGKLLPNKEQPKNTDKYLLTDEQLEVIQDIGDRITVDVDKKTGIINLAVTMQDPFISAYVADTLTSYLQSYIISYRTEKARQDLYFSEQLFIEAKNDYDKAQQDYADYLDRNQNVILASFKVNQEKLQQVMSLNYSVFTQIAQQLQLAKVKVQDLTPVYTIIQPAIMPSKPTKPNKKLIIIGFIFLFGLGACLNVLGKDYLRSLKS